MSLMPVVTKMPRGLRKSSSTQFHESYSFPAPTRGVDALQSLANADPQTAIQIDNLFCRAYGLELRAGYTRWNGILPASGFGQTLMPYIDAADPTVSRLFMAATDGNVYDVTPTQAAPTYATSVLTVAGQTNPGEAFWVNAVTQAGSFLCVVFPGAGYWTYSNATGWVAHTFGGGAWQIANINPTTFGYVLAWQNRLIFIQTGTSNVWYLPVYTISGAATVFEFGMLFTRGGYLAVAAPWTMDSGEGIFSRLVLIGSEGDVVMYSGADLADAAAFEMAGRWYVGRVPVGRRFITRFGADMAILSERGLLMMTDIMQGGSEEPNRQAARRVNQLLQPDVRASINYRYWEVKVLTDIDALVVNSPVARFNTDYLWTFDMTSFGASRMTVMPFTCIEMLGGQSYACDNAGNVWLLWTGNSDGAVGAVRGTDIQGDVQTSFASLGDAVRWKRFLMVRAGFRSSAAPAVQVALNSEWTFAPPSLSPVYNQSSGSVWNTGLWNTALWSGSTQTYKVWTGATGMGRYGSLALSVRGEPGTLFTDWDCVAESGGIL